MVDNNWQVKSEDEVSRQILISNIFESQQAPKSQLELQKTQRSRRKTGTVRI